MERMWQQVADEARKESEGALQAAASRQQELNAARDEARHLQDRITELTALEANWRRRAEAAQQQVRVRARPCPLTHVVKHWRQQSRQAHRDRDRHVSIEMCVGVSIDDALLLLSPLLQFLDHVSTTADRDTLSSSQIANLQQQLETSRAAAQL
jgi:hypothetical protein